MKEIMNVNRRILVVMIKLMIMVNYAPFYLITDPDLCARCYLHEFTLSDRLLGCHEQPLLERYA